jgi:predicted DNA-binding transcriptional regulator AlpA
MVAGRSPAHKSNGSPNFLIYGSVPPLRARASLARLSELRADAMSNQIETEDIYLSANQVRRRYGNISDMALWRWLRDPEVDFPKPIVISGRRYFRLTDLQEFEIRAARRAVAEVA